MDGLIFKGDRIMIPSVLLSEMLCLMHQGHLGIEKCPQKARQVHFWPNMNKDNKNMVSSCFTCQRHKMSNPREPIIPHRIPDRSWQIVGTDLFEWDGSSFFFIVDYYSHFIEIEGFQNSQSATVIKETKGIFTRYGISERVINDNGPCYACHEHAVFAKDWDFKHVTSSPLYPRSNSLSEKLVQVVKHLLTKAKESRKDPYLALLELRCTPVNSLESPAKLLMSRNLRLVLPATDTHWKPKVLKPSKVINQRSMCQERQKK